MKKYDSIEQFYNKFKFSDFIKFHESHYDLFNNGFHLSKDELLSIFTSLDSQKKNFLTLQDLQNKLSYFNFYKKMHFDIKDFFQTNFQNGVDADKIHIKELIARLTDGVEEVIIATNPDVCGELTSTYLANLIKPLGIKVTRLAYGISLGSEIEYVDEITLQRALMDRRTLLLNKAINQPYFLLHFYIIVK